MPGLCSRSAEPAQFQPTPHTMSVGVAPCLLPTALLHVDIVIAQPPPSHVNATWSASGAKAGCCSKLGNEVMGRTLHSDSVVRRCMSHQNPPNAAATRIIPAQASIHRGPPVTALGGTRPWFHAQSLGACPLQIERHVGHILKAASVPLSGRLCRRPLRRSSKDNPDLPTEWPASLARIMRRCLRRDPAGYLGESRVTAADFCSTRRFPCRRRKHLRRRRGPFGWRRAFVGRTTILLLNDPRLKARDSGSTEVD